MASGQPRLEPSDQPVEVVDVGVLGGVPTLGPAIELAGGEPLGSAQGVELDRSGVDHVQCDEQCVGHHLADSFASVEIAL